ncbi:hypothetical protein N3K66_004138 [Trichothecium roseum]|uniref:Uncharacterized protein n=1 Tax=Trichothecium roseum TaxID=47278 RepID=A0ACC0V158_9HYPO|nr:hypothetical protein N3K66_004138 [Trichothecium roseum]
MLKTHSAISERPNASTADSSSDKVEKPRDLDIGADESEATPKGDAEPEPEASGSMAVSPDTTTSIESAHERPRISLDKDMERIQRDRRDLTGEDFYARYPHLEVSKRPPQPEDCVSDASTAMAFLEDLFAPSDEEDEEGESVGGIDDLGRSR